MGFQQESEQLDKRFEHYKARKSYDRAKKEADDKFDEDFEVAEEKRAKGLKAAKKKFTFRKKKIKEGDRNKTKEEEPKTNEDNIIKEGAKTDEDNIVKDEPNNNQDNKIKEKPKSIEFNKIKEEPKTIEVNKIKEEPKTIEVYKTEENDKTGVKDKKNNLKTKVSSIFKSKVDSHESSNENSSAKIQDNNSKTKNQSSKIMLPTYFRKPKA